MRIVYLNGDVPKGKGVCTDVVIRVYWKLGIDLQKEVQEDMKSNFKKYPKNWGLSNPDKNIDHRCVLNLMTFLVDMVRFYQYQPQHWIIYQAKLFAGI